MKRLGLLPLALALAACNSGTFVVLDFTDGPGDATSIECSLSLAGKTASATFSNKGKGLEYPVEGSLQIESGSGAMSVQCDAKTENATVGSVTGTVNVVHDHTEHLTLAFQVVGPDMPIGDGAMPEDGGTNDGGDMTRAPTTLTAMPGSHDYGTVTTNTTSPNFPITITNTGSTQTGPLEVTIDNAVFVSQSSGTCKGTQLSPGATCVVQVAFAPTAANAQAGNLKVTYAGLPDSDAATATLNGTGAVGGSLGWSAMTYDFGSAIANGAGGNTQTFTLTNNSTTTTTGTIAISIAGTDVAAFTILTNTCGSVTLAPSATCQVEVQFTPDMAGDVAPSLEAMATPGGTTTVVLMGHGLAPAQLVLTPDTSTTPYDFGTVNIGTASSMFTITITNSGDVATSDLAYTANGLDVVTGTNGGSCAASGTAAIDAKASCTLVVTTTPTTYGPHTGSVVFSEGTNDTVTANTTVTGQDYVTVMAAQAGTPIVGGSGTVTGSAMMNGMTAPQMIDCSSTMTMCEVVFARTADLTVTLTETPDTGSSFVRWTTANGPDCMTNDTMTTCVLLFNATSYPTGGSTNTNADNPPTYTAMFTSL